jgi:hypothetical protein
MAKIKMICPYSHRLCSECPTFRGRHYYLCFCKEYKGYLGEENKEKDHRKKETKKEF